MSYSRLEKFIYAICSMDVSDLPVPLSRIETLWNCLITGETPDFEPLSRNEKYLMAMLDRYDISNLPAPMSRGEKLLYKIAVGKTDLSDVPGYLSRYEELLKYLIENGGISGGDFEYVLHTINQSLYTLYTTAEKPVKSAILKGNSEVVAGKNKCNMEEIKTGWIDGTTGEVTDGEGVFIPVEVSGTITISNYIHTDIRYVYEYDANGKYLGRTRVTSGIVTLVLTQNTTLIKIGFYKGTLSTVKSLELQVEQGEIATEYEPYNPTLVSVKMPVLTTTGKNIMRSLLKIGSLSNNGVESDEQNRILTEDFIDVSRLDLYTISSNHKIRLVYFYDNNKKFIRQFYSSDGVDTYTSSKANKESYIKIIAMKSDNSNFTTNDLLEFQLMIEQGSVATSYEPYKSNILTVNEPVELRGIGNVRDTLDCLTGEVVERIGEIVFDGSEEWNSTNKETDNYIMFRSSPFNVKFIPPICDKFKTYSSHMPNISESNGELLNLQTDNSCFQFIIKKEKLSTNNVEGFKQWLSQNPTTVQYQLNQESIKTVDLTTVDQDGRPTQLGTFENITHVSLEAENLIPEVEMEVANRISTELASASPLMDDISTEQQQLNTTIDEQSENVDATMIATTEIFEETL